MAERSKPPFRADQVGSLIRPQALIEAREKKARGEIGADELKRIQEDAIGEVVRQQEAIGLKSITDGEFNRGTWQTDFLLRFANVTQGASRFSTTFHNEKGTTESKPHMVQVTGKLSRPAPIFVDDFRFLKSVTRQTPKITLPSPSIMHFRGGREAISAEAYPDMAEFYEDLAGVYREEIADLADAGCRYVQLDEVNFAYLCDPALRAQVQTNLGEDPDQLSHTYARLINDTIRDRPADMVACMHLCRGNFAGRWVAEGGLRPGGRDPVQRDQGRRLLHGVRHRPRRRLRAPALPAKGKTVVLGLVTTKKGAIESKDELKRRIEEAATFAPLDQLCLSPQCGFSSGIGGQTMTVDEEMAKLRLCVEVAQEIWG
ncbi:MAG: 5-methyltetrahydropteroyltriglutamate--homocysteine S-methyltransferase [Caulobacteraceae bacterium]